MMEVETSWAGVTSSLEEFERNCNGQKLAGGD
jgi:hypothetical protein